MDADAERLQSFSRHLQRRRIQVQPEQFAIGRRGLKDAEGVPPCPDGSVDVASARLRLQAAYYFFVKNRNVHVGRRMTIDDCYWLFVDCRPSSTPIAIRRQIEGGEAAGVGFGIVHVLQLLIPTNLA